jgi:hypothetical protein
MRNDALGDRVRLESHSKTTPNTIRRRPCERHHIHILKHIFGVCVGRRRRRGEGEGGGKF